MNSYSGKTIGLSGDFHINTKKLEMGDIVVDIWPETIEQKVKVISWALSTFRSYAKDGLAADPPEISVYTDAAATSGSSYMVIVYKPYLTGIMVKYFVTFDKERTESEKSVTHSTTVGVVGGNFS